MSTIKENIAKLNEASQRRGEFSRNLDEYISVHQDSLPQEVIAAWEGFEVSEKEAKTMETKAIKGIKREIRNVRLIEKLDAVTRFMIIGLFIFSIGHTFYITFSAIYSSRYSMPKGLGECNSLFGC